MLYFLHPAVRAVISCIYRAEAAHEQLAPGKYYDAAVVLNAVLAVILSQALRMD